MEYDGPMLSAESVNHRHVIQKVILLTMTIAK